MDLSPDIVPTATRHDGWTDARKALFLETLAVAGTVRAACARVGLSREAAYRLRRRDAHFGRAWDAALVLSRQHAGDVLATRALDGFPEEVWLRGELMGTKTRFDSRLLLAHLGRLDQHVADNKRALADAARFEELVALATGTAVPDELPCDAAGLPLDRDRAIDHAVAVAEDDCLECWPEILAELAAEAGVERLDYEAEEAERESCWTEARDIACSNTAERWDDWHGAALATVDRLLAEASDKPAWTLSTVSTSPDCPALPTDDISLPAGPASSDRPA